MFIDASALVAILLKEPEAEAFISRIEASDGALYFSSMTRYEASIGVARAKATTAHQDQSAAIETALMKVDALLAAFGATEISIRGEIGTLAITAAWTYGKAVRHPADLNFGDCFSYACAKSLGVPLLYKGRDFAGTDLA